MDEKVSLALLLSLFAGLSTGIGGAVVLFAHRRGTRLLSFCLGFSAGVMVLISVGDLMPESYTLLQGIQGERYGGISVFISVISGMLLAGLINMFVPSGEEVRAIEPDQSAGKIRNTKILRVGIVSTIGIVLHNFPEGIATFMAGCHSLSLGLPVALSVAMHNIPEGIAIAVPIYYGTGSKGKGILYAVASGLSEPVGAILAFAVLARFVNNQMLGLIFGSVSGIMLFISFAELIPASFDYKHKWTTICGILSGILVMQLGLLIFG